MAACCHRTRMRKNAIWVYTTIPISRCKVLPSTLRYPDLCCNVKQYFPNRQIKKRCWSGMGQVLNTYTQFGRASILSVQYPCECCPFRKNPYICIVKRLWSLMLHIVKVFFRKSFNENVEVFFVRRMARSNTHFVWYLWQAAFCVPIPHIYSSVGYCVVYF